MYVLPNRAKHMSSLQVSTVSIAEALKAGLRAAAAADTTYASALAGLRQQVHLTAIMGMDAQCEDAVSMLCVATGIYAPAPPASKAEHRQLLVRSLALLWMLNFGGLRFGGLRFVHAPTSHYSLGHAYQYAQLFSSFGTVSNVR